MKSRILASTLAVAVCVMGLSTLAFAADAMKGVEVTGKAVCKSETRDGKAMKDCSIAVSSAKAADGKPIANLNGKTVKVTGAKSGEIEKLADKEIVAHGTLSADHTSLELTHASAKPEPPAKK